MLTGGSRERRGFATLCNPLLFPLKQGALPFRLVSQGDGMGSPATDGHEATALTKELNELPVTRLHLFILVACAVGFSFDLAEIAFGSILSAIFSAPPHQVDGTQLSWLLASVYVGAIAGAPLLGWLADK